VGGFDQLSALSRRRCRREARLRRCATTACNRTRRRTLWRANGAVIYRDPDGRDVVFAPWVYGRDPEPDDHASS